MRYKNLSKGVKLNTCLVTKGEFIYYTKMLRSQNTDMKTPVTSLITTSYIEFYADITFV